MTGMLIRSNDYQTLSFCQTMENAEGGEFRIMSEAVCCFGEGGIQQLVKGTSTGTEIP